MFPFIRFIKASFHIVVKPIHCAVWTLELMSSLAFESCRWRRSARGQCRHVRMDLLFNMEQLFLLSVSPASFCRVISEPANYCWAELVTSFSLWICDCCWKCKNLPGEEERKESVAGLKHTCWVSGRNQLRVLILPTAFLLTYHNMQLLHIPLGHGAAPCRWTIMQSFSSQPNSTHISMINCFKWLTHMNYVQMYLFYFRCKVKQQMPPNIFRHKSFYLCTKNAICGPSIIEFMLDGGSPERNITTKDSS